MTTPLQPVITQAGLAAIWRADSTGVAAEITHIGLGTTGYTPLKTQTALRTLQAKYPVSDGQRLSSTQIHLTAIADDARAFWVKEVGFYLKDGTLLAVWSDPVNALAYKSPTAELLLAYDLSLTALPADSVTITSTGAGLNLTLSSELAALASAQIADALRGLQQQDLIDDSARKHLIEGEQISNLLDRVKAAEDRQRMGHEGLMEISVANASGLILLQTLLMQRTYGA